MAPGAESVQKLSFFVSERSDKLKMIQNWMNVYDRNQRFLGLLKHASAQSLHDSDVENSAGLWSLNKKPLAQTINNGSVCAT